MALFYADSQQVQLLVLVVCLCLLHLSMALFHAGTATLHSVLCAFTMQ